MKVLLFTLLAIRADSARVNTKRNSDKNRVDPSKCAGAVPGSTMVPEGWLSSHSEDSEWCTCPEGQRLLGRNLACSGKVKFNPDAVNFQGCDCRVPPAFVCPHECWECCTGSSGDIHFKESNGHKFTAEFKCIIKRDVSTMPFGVIGGLIEDELVEGRTCTYPTPRSNNATTWKTYCSAEEWEMQTIPSNGCTSKSKTTKQFQWAVSKVAEVPSLLWNGGGNMIEMGSIIKYIKGHTTFQNTMYLPLSQIVMIHPINSAQAVQKTAMRARLMRASVSTLEEHDRKFSRSLFDNDPSLKLMSSKEGFQVLQIASNPNRYLAFEGNGRLAATRWAFPETEDASAMRNTLQLEVKNFVLVGKHLAEAVKRIAALRTSFQTDAFEALVPPSLEDEDVATYIKDNFPPKTE